MKWKYHLKELGFDLALGLAFFLAPLVESNDFSWSVHWWLAAGGAIARRAIGITLGWVRRTLRERIPPE
jgi:hypothetical protein